MERSGGHGQGEREIGVRERRKSERERRGREGEEEPNSPTYSKLGLPGCCEVTVGQSLEGMLTTFSAV